MLPSERKGKCTTFRSVATYELCVWSSRKPISGICSLLEISVTYSLPFYLSTDFLILPKETEVLIGRTGETGVVTET